MRSPARTCGRGSSRSSAERPTLLVLDNCEQVIDAVARWVADTLAAVSSLRVLTTSRTPLTIAAEAVYPLAALSSEADDPDSVGPAAQLFLDRARAVRPDAVLPIDVVVRLCDRLDGLPLAIELAAARVRSMTPEQIEARLRDRFALLTTGDRAAPERHRTLQAVIEWSWDLVDSEARAALATLSLLPAGFTAPTAAAVLGIPFAEDLLDRLVSQSLLIVADDPRQRRAAVPDARDGPRVRSVPARRRTPSSRTRGTPCCAGPPSTRRSASTTCSSPPVYRELHERARQPAVGAALRHRPRACRGCRGDRRRPRSGVDRARLVLGAHQPRARPCCASRPSPRSDDVSPDARAVTLILGAIATPGTGRRRASPRSLARLRITLRRGGVSDRWAAFARGDHRQCRPGSASPRSSRSSRASDKPAIALMGELIAAQFAENEGDAAGAMIAARRAWEIADETGDVWVAATAASTAATLASQSAHPAEALEWLDRSVAGFQAFGAENELRQQAWARGGSLVSLGRLDEARVLFSELAGASRPHRRRARTRLDRLVRARRGRPRVGGRRGRGGPLRAGDGAVLARTTSASRRGS